MCATWRERTRLLRRHLRRRDELRHPLVAALEIVAVHRLELGLRERVRRGTREQRVAPGPKPPELLDMAEPLHPVEEDVALQERRIGGVQQRVAGTVEERA